MKYHKLKMILRVVLHYKEIQIPIQIYSRLFIDTHFFPEVNQQITGYRCEVSSEYTRNY